MATRLKCVIKESKSNLAACGAILPYIPKFIGIVGLMFLPLFVGALWVYFNLFPNLGVKGDTMLLWLLPITILWVIFIAFPILDSYFLKKNLKETYTTMWKLVSELIPFIAKAGLAVILSLTVLTLPTILYLVWLFSNNPIPIKMDGVELMIVLAVTIMWAILVGFPVVDCYILPQIEDKEPTTAGA